MMVTAGTRAFGPCVLFSSMCGFAVVRTLQSI